MGCWLGLSLLEVVLWLIANDVMMIGCVYCWEELWGYDLGFFGDYEEESKSFVYSDSAGYEVVFEE
jgi:hypothetical protein